MAKGDDERKCKQKTEKLNTLVYNEDEMKENKMKERRKNRKKRLFYYYYYY